ncbi:hypothetical protein M569_10797, partial [Genlisea aurea]
RSRRHRRKNGISGGGFVVPRGSRGWPFVGETLEFIACGRSSRPVSFMEKRRALYGNVFETHILGKPIIVSTDPEVNRMILQNHGDVFAPCYPKSITELLGNSSMLQMNGPSHKRMHTLITAFLKSPQLKLRITREIESLVRFSLSAWRDRSSSRVCIQDETKKITFEILVKVLLGIDSSREIKEMKLEFEELIKGLICLPIKLPGTRLYRSLQAKKRLTELIRKTVERKKTPQEKTLPENVIDLLVRENGGGSSDNRLDSIIGNIVEMMVPGEESVPTAMTLAVKFLMDNPIALAHLREENMELRKRKTELNEEEYTWSDYISLPFTQNVINETLRMANIVNAVWRKACKDVRLKGYLIPEGRCVMAAFCSIHMDETNYKNPYDFDPWRWKDMESSLSSQIFTPFGGGQRLCPGIELSRLEISIFLHHLTTTYRIAAAERDEIIYFPTVRMKRKLPITVSPL